MIESLTSWIDLFTNSNKVFYLTLSCLCILGLFLIYLGVALIIHRKDRKELEKLAISEGVDIQFQYSWKGVELKITHPTDRSKIQHNQGNQPPSPPLEDRIEQLGP